MPDDHEQQITQIKNTIAALENQRGVLPDEVVDASIAALQEKISLIKTKSEPTEQQRKLVTLLFMDTVGSTRMYHRLDPEVTRDIQDGILKRMAEIVHEQGGHVTRYMGDGFKAVFGIPLARENEPECAVRAGLGILEIAKEIARELDEQQHIAGFQVRVGVNTGLVAVGGVTEASDTVMGAPVNLAARLESAAPPGGLLISHDTYRHLRGLFEVEPQPPVSAKGFDDPVAVYLVKGLKPRAFHMPERGVEGVQTRLIGRDMEFHLLQDNLHHILQDREAQAITISGEAGVGKSRLLMEFLDLINKLPENLDLFLGRSEQEKQSQPYALLRNLFASHFNIQENDPPEVVWQKMEKGMVGHVTIHEALVAGQLAGFDLKVNPDLEEFVDTPQQLRDQGTRIIQDYFLSATKQAPVLICLEDIHWADDSSLDLFNSIGQNLQNQRLLILYSARNSLFERRPFWGEGQPFHNRIKLQPLSKWDSRLLVEEILKQVEPLPTELRDLVVSGAEGNPFYIEEMIKMLFEQGIVSKGDREAENRPNIKVEPNQLVRAHIPSTLTGVLQARLDGLPIPERALLQQASVIGRFFWDQAVDFLNLTTNAGHGQESVSALLSSLRSRELVFRREVSAIAGAQEYLFKHEVLREVTYESIPLRTRRIYHGQAAQWLMDYSGERVGEYAGQIAEHLELAGRKEEAVNCLLQAGDQAASRFANPEAIQFYKRGIVLVRELPDNPTRGEQELELWTALGVPLVIQKGYGGEETFEAYQQAHDLCGRLGKEPSPPVLRGLVIAGLVRGELDQSYQYGSLLLGQAEKLQDSLLLTEAHYALGVTLYWQGNFKRSKEHLEQALVNYNPTDLSLHIKKFSQDPMIICLVRLGLSLWYLGYPEQALQKIEEGVSKARELGHLYSLVYALAFSAQLTAVIPDLEATHQYAQEAVRLGVEHQVFLGVTISDLIEHWANSNLTNHEIDINQFAARIADINIQQTLQNVHPFMCAMLADLLERADQPQEGLILLSEALEKAERQGVCWYQAELLRRIGELHQKQTDGDEIAETFFQKAMQTAQHQEARSLELRAALSLGQLWQTQGKGEEARQLVSEIYAKFTEGFETHDLRRAAEFLKMEDLQDVHQLLDN